MHKIVLVGAAHQKTVITIQFSWENSDEASTDEEDLIDDHDEIRARLNKFASCTEKLWDRSGFQGFDHETLQRSHDFRSERFDAFLAQISGRTEREGRVLSYLQDVANFVQEVADTYEPRATSQDHVFDKREKRDVEKCRQRWTSSKVPSKYSKRPLKHAECKNVGRQNYNFH